MIDFGLPKLKCPDCNTIEPFTACLPECSSKQTDLKQEGYLTLLSNPNSNQKTQSAYREYSKNYAILALLVYWIIWRGKLRKHIAFFSGILTYGDKVVDLAIGEGSVTTLALFRGKRRAKEVLAFDFTKEMLGKAHRLMILKKKLPVRLVRADIMAMPILDNTVSLLTCFGGLNSFTSVSKAFAEIHRVLKPGGIARFSYLLRPDAKWKQKNIDKWISQGHQCNSFFEHELRGEIGKSGLHFVMGQRCGDVFFFELKR